MKTSGKNIEPQLKEKGTRVKKIASNLKRKMMMMTLKKYRNMYIYMLLSERKNLPIPHLILTQLRFDYKCNIILHFYAIFTEHANTHSEIKRLMSNRVFVNLQNIVDIQRQNLDVSSHQEY